MRDERDILLQAARREAEIALLDRHYFELSADAFERFSAMLDKPPEDNPKLRRLFEVKAPWD